MNRLRFPLFSVGLGLALICLLLDLSSIATAQNYPPMPSIEGESFSGRKVVIPGNLSGKIGVLVLGFSKASKTQTAAWADRIEADFGTQPAIALYQLPVLEDVPSLVRGMVISSIRKSVPEKKREQFVPVLHGEKELKGAVHFQEKDDAYLILLDRNGAIVDQTHGAPNDERYSRLREHIKSLLNSKQ